MTNDQERIGSVGSRKREGKDGTVDYMALYRDLKGEVRSAGTFTTERKANKAWQAAEAEVAKGRSGNPERGRQTFKKYVLEIWLPNRQVEVSTRQSYTYSIHKHLIPELGKMRMVDILPEHAG
jgi:hypothetical protein